jgi:phosphoribosylamine--glycine ligase
MGAYAPAPIVTPQLMTEIQGNILQPVIKTLQSQGIDYRGVLYAGLIISPTGEIKVLEFNCRFGDPETQAILPLLDSSLADLLLACSEQRLGQLPSIAWKSQVSVCVVIAAGGYPTDYHKGNVITGLDEANHQGVQVFHGGTQLKNGKILTDGGRVLGVTSIADDYPTAIELAYQGVEAIDFTDKYYRQDIAQRALKS